MKTGASLSRLFVTAFTFFLILPLAVVFMFYLITIYDSNSRKTAQELQFLSHSASERVNATLEGTAKYLVSLAEVLHEEKDINPDRLIMSGVKNFGLLDNIYVLDQDKKISVLSFSQFSRYSENDFIGIALNDVHGFDYFEPYWSSPFRSMLTSSYVVRVSVKYPGGYVVGDINLQFLSDSFMKAKDLGYMNIFVVDSRGDIISYKYGEAGSKHENLFNHPAVQEAMKGNHTAIGYKLDGVKYSASGYKIPIVDWYLIKETEHRKAFSLFYDILYVTFFSALLAGFFILLVLFVIKRRLINPITVLIDKSSQLSEGEMPDFGKSEQSGFVELERLYLSFKEMAEKIEERELALRQKEEYVRTVFDSTTNTGILVVSSGSDGVITDANTGAQLILGYKASELIGLPPAALVRDIGDDINRMQKEARRRESMVTARFEMTKKNGINLPVLCTAHPFLGGSGDDSMFVVVFMDITEITRVQSALESEKERLDVTLKSIGEGVVAADRTGRITLVNSSAESILGQKHRYMVGHNVKDILQIYDYESGEDLSYILVTVSDHSKKTLRANIISENQGVITVTLTASSMLNGRGDIIGFVYVFRDITERIKMEKELINRKKQLEEINRNLEIRVSEETEKRRKNEQLLFEQAKFAAMGQMISAIAHQWRQPLNALALYTQDIEDAYQAEEVDAGYLHRYVQNSMSLINHMSGTIDDFRNFFHSDNIRESVNLVHVMVKSLELVSSQLRNQNINFEFCIKSADKEDVFVNSMPPADNVYGKDVYIFPSEMKQVLLNIIQNARDAISERKAGLGARGGNIYISLEYRSDKIVLSVSNDGGKIPEESLVRIFDPYYTTKAEGEGTGIGLFMSKTMVEDHIGGLLVAENVEYGAKFTITIYYDS